MKDEIHHLSISQINEYLGCSQQYFYHRITELEPCDVSSALVVGSAIHSAIEHFNILKKEGVTTGLTEMEALFRQCILNDEEDQSVNYGRASREEVFKLAPIWLQAFLDTQNEKERVLRVEDSFEIMLPGLPVPVVGRVDAVLEDEEGAVVVVDYKTASAKPSSSDISSNLQMTLYGIWAKRAFPNSQIKLRMDYLIKSKRIPSFMKMPTTRTEIQEQALAMLFTKVYNHISMLRAEVIDPLPVSSWKCGGCGYRHACQQSLVAA